MFAFGHGLSYTDFEYDKVDQNEAYDDCALQEQEVEEKYFEAESPSCVDTDHDDKTLEGETGVQDY